MNAHAFPLTATVDATRAPSGMHGATVDNGLTDSPLLFVGYLDRESALVAGRRFAEAMGRRAIMPPDYAERPDKADRAELARVGRHGDGRRRSRRHVRAAKSAWLNGGI